MKYSTLFKTLQNLTGFKPSVTDIASIIDVPARTLYTRGQRDSNFSYDEIALIEAHYGIELSQNSDCIEIDYIHINPSCGKGTVVLDDAVVTPVKIGKEVIKNLWSINNPDSLKIFKASGDSMEDIIEDGNLLLVDTSRKDFNNGGIFVLTINNDWFVKRLRLRVTGELDIISDNDKYPLESLKPDSNVEVTIKGRVIKNLSRGL